MGWPAVRFTSQNDTWSELKCCYRCTQVHRTAAASPAAKPSLLPRSAPRSLAAGSGPGRQPVSCPLSQGPAAGAWRAAGGGRRRGTSRWCSRTWNVVAGFWGFALPRLWAYGVVIPARGARRQAWTVPRCFASRMEEQNPRGSGQSAETGQQSTTSAETQSEERAAEGSLSWLPPRTGRAGGTQRSRRLVLLTLFFPNTQITLVSFLPLHSRIHDSRIALMWDEGVWENMFDQVLLQFLCKSLQMGVFFL